MQHVFRLTGSLGFVFLIGNWSNVWACTSIKVTLFKIEKRNFLMIQLTNYNYSPPLSVMDTVVTSDEFGWFSAVFNILLGGFLCKFFYLLFSLPRNDVGDPLKTVPINGLSGGIQFYHDLRGAINPFLFALRIRSKLSSMTQRLFLCLLSCSPSQIDS